jgi:hypothetical protein
MSNAAIGGVISQNLAINNCGQIVDRNSRQSLQLSELSHNKTFFSNIFYENTGRRRFLGIAQADTPVWLSKEK